MAVQYANLCESDSVGLLTVFAKYVCPYVELGQENPAVTYWQEVFPILSTILENFITFPPLVEQICSCWRSMLLSYRTAMTPMLPELANKLASGFQTTRDGCFLWATGAVLLEFSEHRDSVDPAITESIYTFFEAQAVTFLKALSQIKPQEFGDAIEDFFRLVTDALLYYPHKLIPSALLTPIFEGATYSLLLEQRNPARSTLDFLCDLLTWGSNNPASSNKLPAELLAQFRATITGLLGTHGEKLMNQVIAGLVYHFHVDCYSSATGVIVEMLQVMPQQTMGWLKGSLDNLPTGTVTAAELDQLMSKIHTQVAKEEPHALREVRSIIDHFAYNYRRRHIAPRDGLGQMEAETFRFAG